MIGFDRIDASRHDPAGKRGNIRNFGADLRASTEMGVQFTPRDYRLAGPENKRAVERGLATATWYTCPIPRKRLKELMQRKDGPAIRDTRSEERRVGKECR